MKKKSPTADAAPALRFPAEWEAHAATLLAMMLAAAPLAAHVPLAALAAILVGVAINMGEWHAFIHLRARPVPANAIMFVTFALTVALDITDTQEIALLGLRNAVLELARTEPFARPLVNSGRLSTPTPYLNSPLNTLDADGAGFRSSALTPLTETMRPRSIGTRSSLAPIRAGIL